jgi:hypothetical protein
MGDEVNGPLRRRIHSSSGRGLSAPNSDSGAVASQTHTPYG